MSRYFLQPPKKDKKGEVVETKDDVLGQTQEIAQRRHEVLDYMLLQMDDIEIAEEMDIELHTVQNDIQFITKTGFKGRDEDLELIRDEVVAKMRYTWDKARREFDESKRSKEKRQVEYGEGGVGDVDEDGEWQKGGKIVKEKITIEERVGDAKFLQVMNDSAEKMAKVTGAQKHKEVQINNNMQQNTTTILSPNRSRLPSEFDEFLDKPEGEMTPEQRRDAGLDDIENEDI